jgi:ferredoxin
MTGGGWLLDRRELEGWLEGLLADGVSLVAPAAEQGRRQFRAIAAVEELALAPGNPVWSPKEVLLPQTEALFFFEREGAGTVLRDAAPPASPRTVLFGVRCCDVAGIGRLDRFFLGAVVDPYYARRRAALSVVAVACSESVPGCFCTAVGGSPVDCEGSDVLLVPLSEGWLATAKTNRGQALIEPFSSSWRPASDDHWQQVDALRQRLEAALAGGQVGAAWPRLLEAAFDHPLWQRLAETCVGCSVCSSVCPSCSCFDMHDEGGAAAGVKFRCWDSCSLPLFTRHASGHNPRQDRGARFRQRVLHKFAYHPLKFTGELGCVGCGRCLALCPAGLDILGAVRQVVAAVGGGAAGAGGG